MTSPKRGETTRLLAAWRDGDDAAGERLLPLVYAELHEIASRCMRDERGAATLQPTALVHEAYLRLVGSDVTWEGRRHFFAVAARTMRRVLVDHARARLRDKRGAGAVCITLQDRPQPDAGDPLDVIAIDAALERLAALDQRKARAIELHYFAGLDYDEIAATLGVSAATVHRDLRFARRWMYDQLRKE
ncbi:MAG TPA: sigma-70 family RNA polymerase sigma factor [Gemmatimonadaceae bacterium]|nr:sigma-70 family RNA polymerase sigma factor [Gemmatimonadaceae bacterium]